MSEEHPWVQDALRWRREGLSRSQVVSRLMRDGAWQHVAEDIADAAFEEEPA